MSSSIALTATSAVCPPSLPLEQGFILQASGTGTVRDGQYVQVFSLSDGDDDALGFADISSAATFSLTTSGRFTTLNGNQGDIEEANIDARDDTDSVLFFDTDNQLSTTRANLGDTTYSTCTIGLDGVLTCTTGLNLVFYVCDDSAGVIVGPTVPNNPTCYPLTLTATAATGSSPACPISITPPVTVPSVTLPPTIATVIPTAAPQYILQAQTYPVGGEYISLIGSASGDLFGFVDSLADATPFSIDADGHLITNAGTLAPTTEVAVTNSDDDNLHAVSMAVATAMADAEPSCSINVDNNMLSCGEHFYACSDSDTLVLGLSSLPFPSILCLGPLVVNAIPSG